MWLRFTREEQGAGGWRGPQSKGGCRGQGRPEREGVRHAVSLMCTGSGREGEERMLAHDARSCW
eukprot:5398876-Pleurochrysis_carterae.AAC.1